MRTFFAPVADDRLYAMWLLLATTACDEERSSGFGGAMWITAIRKFRSCRR